MAEFRVRWAIDVDAETAFEAAAKAFTMQQDPMSTATVFEVAKIASLGSAERTMQPASWEYETIDLQGDKVERDRHDH